MTSLQPESSDLSPEASWRTIHETMDHSRSGLYLAGTSSILLLWGGIMAVGYFMHFGISSLATDFADQYPWFPAPLWIALGTIGFIGSGIIGRRAGQNLSDNYTARRAGLRVFLFWLAVTFAAIFVPAAAGMWTPDHGPLIPGVTIGIIALGYILFGIMHRTALAVVGIGIAAAYYIPNFLLDDAAHAVTALAMLVVVFMGALWLRKSGVA